MQFQVRHTGRRAPSLRRSTPPSLPSGRGMGSAQGTALFREGGERDFSNTHQAASTNDGKKTAYAPEQGFSASNFLCLYMTENRKTLEFQSCATTHSQNK